MYISTDHYIGTTVFFYDPASDCVTRAKVKEIRIMQYKHATDTSYLLSVHSSEDGDFDVTRREDGIYRDASAAFRANPLPPEDEQAEVAEAVGA